MKLKDRIDQILSKPGGVRRGEPAAVNCDHDEQDHTVRPRSASLNLVPRRVLRQADIPAIRAVVNYLRDELDEYLRMPVRSPSHIGHELQWLNWLLGEEAMNNSAQEADVAEPGVKTTRIYVVPRSGDSSRGTYGRWIDANQGVEALRDEVAEMLKGSREPTARGWAIRDQQGFGPLDLRGIESLDQVAEIARLVGEHGEVFAALMGHFGGLSGLDSARRTFGYGYLGESATLADYAAAFVNKVWREDVARLPRLVADRIDYEAVGYDLIESGDIFVIDHDDRFVPFFAAPPGRV